MPSEKLLDHLAAGEPEAYVELLRNPHHPAHPLMIPCRAWKFGQSKGRPTFRERGHHPCNPMRAYFGFPEKLQRICGTRHCVNPFHHVTVPRHPTGPRHALVYAAEEHIDPSKTLLENYEAIELPRQYVLEAYRTGRQLNLLSLR